jgi:hypothetical protein
MSGVPENDEVYDALTAGFRVRSGGPGLVEIRRAGDEAVLMFRWPPEDRLFGVPVSLNRIDRRIDWDRPAHHLEEWIESVDLWLMEDVENGYRYRARRRAVDDYIELRQPNWPMDERFHLQVNERIEQDWTMLQDITDTVLDARVALAAQDRGALLAWTFAYENNATGGPIVGHSTVTWDGADGARLVDMSLGDSVPATVAVDLVRHATHAAAEAGAQVVTSDIDLASWHPDLPKISGFRLGNAGMTVDTDFLAEDPELATGLLQTALADPGPWGGDRDRSGRYLPNSRIGRLLHRLRHGESGAPPRLYAG